MPQEPKPSTDYPLSPAAALLFGVLGLAGNWFRVPIFSNIDFVFGSFFVMIAVIRHGIGTGIAASLIASSCTLLIWKHPWAMVLWAAEAAFVGWRIKRRGESILLIHDITFWCCCGVPLVWLLYYVLGGESASLTNLIAAKQFVNGVFNALFGSLFQLVLRRVQTGAANQLPTLRHIVFTVMVSLVLVPALFLIVTDVRRSQQEKMRHLAEETAVAATVARDLVSLWLQDHHQVVETLAKQVGDPNRVPPEQIQHSVEKTRATTTAFSRMGILNRRGITIAYSPPRDEFGRSTVGIDYSDRPYIKNLDRSSGRYVGDLFISRIGRPEPIVAMAAPISINGENVGAAIGVLRGEQLRKYLQSIIGADAISITILDRMDQVVTSTRHDLPAMTRFQRKSGGTFTTTGNGVLHWMPPSSQGTPAELWKRSLYLKEATLSAQTPWKVVVESSYAPVQEALQADATFSLAMLILLILVVVPLSQLICRRITADLVTLREETQRLPALVRQGKEVTLPSSNIRDVAGLIDNFRETSAALAQQYQSLDNMNNLLELRVREAEKNRRQLENEIEERSRTERQLLSQQQKLSDLAMELSFAEERERNRIAGELHDQVGQRLLLGKMKLELLANLLPDLVQERDVTEIRTLVEQTLKDIRSLTFQIRPPLLATAGLEAAVQWLGEELEEDYGLRLTFLDDQQAKQLPYEVRSVVFQAVRELLLNVVKHAGTDSASVSFRRERDALLVEVSDDGIGLKAADSGSQPKKEGGFGLFNVQQRIHYLGGRLTIDSRPGEGTRVVIQVPLEGDGTSEGGNHAEHPVG